MSTTNTQSLKDCQRAKDTKLTDQLEIVLQAFKKKPMTMKEADFYTGVMRENICWYVRTLLNEGKIAFLRKRRCKVTGYPSVKEFTGNPELFPKSNQLKIF